MPDRPYVGTNPNEKAKYIVVVDGNGVPLEGDPARVIESYTPEGFKLDFFCFCDQFGNPINGLITNLEGGDGIDVVKLPDGSTQVSLKPASLMEIGGLFAHTPIEGQYVVGLDESGRLILGSIGDIDLPGGTTGTGKVVLQDAPTINGPVIQIPFVAGGQWNGGVMNGMTNHNEVADGGLYTTATLNSPTVHTPVMNGGTWAGGALTSPATDGIKFTAPPGVTVTDGITQHPAGGLDFWTASAIDFSSDSNHLLRSALIDSWGLPKVTATATVPSLLTRRNDLTTGLGGPANELDMIIQGVSQLKADPTGLRNKAGQYIVPYSGRRNRIHNGAMWIDQRHPGNFVVCVNGSNKIIDRWLVAHTTAGAARVTASQYKTNAYSSLTGSQYWLNVFCSTVQAAVGATEFCFLQQSVEGFDISELLWGTPDAKPVTISAVIWTALAGDYAIALRGSAAIQSYVHKLTLAVGVQRVSFTVPGPTTGTWAIDNSYPLTFCVTLAAGATWVTPNMDVWQAGNFLGSPTQVNFWSSTANSMLVTDIQMEIGTVATPYESRSLQQELFTCQRYFQKSFELGVVPGDHGSAVVMTGHAYTTGTIIFGVRFPVPMRANPGILTYNGAAIAGGTLGIFNYLNGAWTPFDTTTPSATSIGIAFSCNKAGAFIANNCYSVDGNWTADCD